MNLSSNCCVLRATAKKPNHPATKTTNKLRVTKPNQAPPHTEEDELEELVVMGAEAD